MMFNTRDRFKFCTWCGRLGLNIGVSFTLVVWGQQTGAKAGLKIYRAPMGGCHWGGGGGGGGHLCICRHCLSQIPKLQIGGGGGCRLSSSPWKADTGTIQNLEARKRVWVRHNGRTACSPTTELQMTLESQAYTKIVMPHPGDALLHYDDIFFSLWHQFGL